MARTAAMAGLVAAALAPAARADVIHLTTGGVIQVDAWRDVGDAIEFTRSGGILRILKSDIQRIEGSNRTTDLRMYSAPTSAAAPAGGGTGTAREMSSIMKEGEALFTQTVLGAQAKAEAFRKLMDKWRALDVPIAVRDVWDRADRALRVSAEAYAAEAEGTAPDTKERIEAAKKAYAEAQADVDQLAKES